MPSMSTPLFILLSLVAVLAVAAGIGALLIAGSLTVAAMLPQGHPQVERLRTFASTAPKKAWRLALALDTVFWVGLTAIFVYLTFLYS
jgi:hypothetical protein